MILDPKNREEWLTVRKRGIGGSDAGVVLGLSKYKSNVQLWEEKTGITEAEDISDKPAVHYGKLAEKNIRELFRLDYPEFTVDYNEFKMFFDDVYTFLFATLDGELTDKETGGKGILEIKTTTIQNASQWDEWDDKIPETYYAQILHQFAVTHFDFAILRAYIRYYKDGTLRATVRDYRIERSEVEADIKMLIEVEKGFWDCVQTKRKPNLILPSI